MEDTRTANIPHPKRISIQKKGMGVEWGRGRVAGCGWTRREKFFGGRIGRRWGTRWAGFRGPRGGDPSSVSPLSPPGSGHAWCLASLVRPPPDPFQIESFHGTQNQRDSGGV